MKIVVVAIILVIVYCLFSAGYFMLTGKRSPHAMAKALAWRIVLSIALFILLLVGFVLGWIHPHGL
jgi:hypothetical protein